MAETPHRMHWIQLDSPEKVLEHFGKAHVSLNMKPRLEQAGEASKLCKEPLAPAPQSCTLSNPRGGREHGKFRGFCTTAHTRKKELCLRDIYQPVRPTKKHQQLRNALSKSHNCMHADIQAAHTHVHTHVRNFHTRMHAHVHVYITHSCARTHIYICTHVCIVCTY